MTSSNPPSAADGSTEGKLRTKGDLFKPVDAKDQEELSLENLRASKFTQNTSSDDVRAPGIFERVKEEVEAIADSIQEDHLHHKSSGNHVGCFSWFPGFGGFHKHQQSQ